MGTEGVVLIPLVNYCQCSTELTEGAELGWVDSLRKGELNCTTSGGRIHHQLFRGPRPGCDRTFE